MLSRCKKFHRYFIEQVWEKTLVKIKKIQVMRIHTHSPCLWYIPSMQILLAHFMRSITCTIQFSRSFSVIVSLLFPSSLSMTSIWTSSAIPSLCISTTRNDTIVSIRRRRNRTNSPSLHTLNRNYSLRRIPRRIDKIFYGNRSLHFFLSFFIDTQTDWSYR